MENTDGQIIIILCKLVHFLQATTQFVIKRWTPEFIKNALKFIAEIENVVSRLADDENLAVQHFLQDSLCSNPYLSQTNRDCIFEYCLDTNRKLPQFNRYYPELHFIPNDLLLIIESRLFGSHISSIKTFSETEKYLDSCFALDNSYTIHLLIRLLEQSEQCDKPDDLRTIIIHWLLAAIQKDHEAYISLASYNPDHLRDLAIHIPDFGRVILKLFDETEHIRFEKVGSEENNQCTLIMNLLINLFKRIIFVDHLNPLLLSQINRLAKKNTSAAEFWNSVACAINMS
ncbi:hypothetical protein MS3_00006441 [Schistosoma haematobium]|uniref:Uncharacterized protein n=1 Tax=Schistosoma haematobium TaxID=6185 RepID=A0A922LHM7_SCHHA|nr:hypothetical protein MS3_00006441 [Schistosoma haematobium]KAH9585065.1 hypothetical protein MS3_00006441 [Schistosoma haematobium]